MGDSTFNSTLLVTGCKIAYFELLFMKSNLKKVFCVTLVFTLLTTAR